jgi:tetratricopeptide (TPR) repeat protein
LAVADELITILSRSPALAVRPFAMTRRFSGDIDPQQIGRTLKVANVITGDYREAAGRLGLTVEAVDVENNNVVWRDSLEVAGDDLIGMRNELANRIRSGLLPKLHAGSEAAESRPKSDEGYARYLRSLAMSTDPGPNSEAIQDLERSVQLDPSYAPAWVALANRYYYAFQYNNAGEEKRTRAEAAHQKALALDPQLIPARRGLIVLRTEAGDLTRAYQDARELVRMRPESGDAHFALSYVLRYAGLLDEAARECETARADDPTNPSFRSCAVVFMLRNDYERAEQFALLDGDSAVSRSTRAALLLRQGKPTEAARLAGDQPRGTWHLLRLYVQHAPAAEIDAQAEATKKNVEAIRDGEPSLLSASTFVACGRADDAVELLRAGIARNYCGTQAIDGNSLFAPLRGRPEFEKIRQDAMACQQRFLQWRAANAP